MPNLLQTAATWLGQRLKASGGRTVVYTRGGVNSSSLTGVPSVVSYTVTDAEGFATTVQSFDWTFTAADVVVSGSAVEPRPGDVITETGATYEVTHLSTDRPCFEWLDTAGELIVIHTRRV